MNQITSYFEIPAMPGAVFCKDVHGHELSGPISELFVLDTNLMFEISSDVAQHMYNQVTDAYCTVVADRPKLMSNKTAYVVSVTEDIRYPYNVKFVLILYCYDQTWYQAVCLRK